MANKKIKKIQDYDRAYCLLHHYVGAIINLAYSRFVQIGRENIPQDGAIIFAPNHTNTLMDALVVLNMDRNPKVFVARADVFKNRKLAKDSWPARASCRTSARWRRESRCAFPFSGPRKTRTSR